MHVGSAIAFVLSDSVTIVIAFVLSDSVTIVIAFVLADSVTIVIGACWFSNSICIG